MRNSLKRKASKSVARLAAVQALYQVEVNAQHPRLTVDEFREYRLGREIDGDQYQKADAGLFERVVMGVYFGRESIDTQLANFLPKSRPLVRLEPLILAVLRAACFELESIDGAPAKVVVNEYMDLAHAFFSGQEPRFVNGVLDAVAHKVRPEDFKSNAETTDS